MIRVALIVLLVIAISILLNLMESHTTIFQVQSVEFRRTSRQSSEGEFLLLATTTDDEWKETSERNQLRANNRDPDNGEFSANNATDDEWMEDFDDVPSLTDEAEEVTIAAEPYKYKPDAADPRPRNLRLAFIGDSVTRYQYIALAYFLKTGEWITEALAPNPLHRRNFGRDLNNYFRGSNALLSPEEQCDGCMQPGSFSENRYFSDPERGNFVTYITKFGSKPSNGHWWPAEAAAANDDAVDKPNVVNATTLIPYKWVYGTWTETILEHVAKLPPKPDFLVFNAGLHPNQLHVPEIRNSIVEAANEAGILPIYKTTTYPRTIVGGSDFGPASHDDLLCGTAVTHCLDLSWTSDLEGPKNYYDNSHFTSVVNARMNLQLLEYLQIIVSSGENATARFGGSQEAER